MPDDTAAPLNGITEADFGAWKHHPVTKVYLRYVLDYASLAKRELADGVCASESSLDQLAIGKLSGRVLAWLEMATLEYSHIVSFYAASEPEDKQEDHA